MDEDEIDDLIDAKLDERSIWEWSPAWWNWWTASLTVIVICIIGFGFCS